MQTECSLRLSHLSNTPAQFTSIEKADWTLRGLSVIVRNGNAHLSGVMTNGQYRQAEIVAAENVLGVKKVHDHLCWVEPMSGMYLNSQEDKALLRAN